jgi:hypothetical protein
MNRDVEVDGHQPTVDAVQEFNAGRAPALGDPRR